VLPLADAEAAPWTSDWAASTMAALPAQTSPQVSSEDAATAGGSAIVVAKRMTEGAAVSSSAIVVDGAEGLAEGLAESLAEAGRVEGDDASILFPTFGEFIDKQLLPLYFRDVPFEKLTYLAEHYCGVPLDSDDEEQARKFLGQPKRAPSPGKRRQLKRHRTGSAASDPLRALSEAGTSSMDADVSPTSSHDSTTAAASTRRMLRRNTSNAALETPLSDLLPAKQEPRLRSQMSTSVAEKRRKGVIAAPDMQLNKQTNDLLRAILQKPGSSRGGFAGTPRVPGGSSRAGSASTRRDVQYREAGLPSARQVNPSRALFSSPAPARLVLESKASPLSTRAVRYRVLESAMPEWDLLDQMETPRKS